MNGVKQVCFCIIDWESLFYVIWYKYYVNINNNKKNEWTNDNYTLKFI